MTDKETTPPPPARAATTQASQPQPEGAQTIASIVSNVATEPLPDNYEVEAQDDTVSDSGFGTENESDTTSISSSIYAGMVENGRRYQTTREGDYYVPTDEKQFESQHSVHLMHLVLDSGRENPLFYAPIGDNPQRILDIGTGPGTWAIDVADKYPSAIVTGTDLYPPPNTWLPPNCILMVEDAIKHWAFTHRFDLIHLRWLFSALTAQQWKGLYKQAYENLLPGGWIEQTEPDVHFYCDDGTLPPNSACAGWGKWCIDACAQGGRPLDIVETMKSTIEACGFTNVHEKIYKVPMGAWTKNRILKDAGRINKEHFLAGMEGYSMFVQTRFGLPKPWTPEEVQAHLAQVRKELNNSGMHAYFIVKRIWAQKPLDAKPASSEPDVAAENAP